MAARADRVAAVMTGAIILTALYAAGIAFLAWEYWRAEDWDGQ
jgi:hypothetical protein